VSGTHGNRGEIDPKPKLAEITKPLIVGRRFGTTMRENRCIRGPAFFWSGTLSIPQHLDSHFLLCFALKVAHNIAGGFSKMEDVMCRAELHGTPTRDQYVAFHDGMRQLGLERTITRDAKIFRLPTGEYLGVSLSASLASLATGISALAIQIPGCPCKLMLGPVDATKIYILCLEEEETPSFASALGVSLFNSSAGSTSNR
jgi:hypothetical protein